MGTVFTWVTWGGFAFFAGVIILGIAQMARTGGWREARSWTGLLILVSAAVVPLTVLGVLPALADAFLLAGPLAVIAVRCWPVWRHAAKNPKFGKAGATGLIFSLLWDRLRGTLWSAREGGRELAGLLRREPGRERHFTYEPSPEPGRTPPPGGTAAPRQVPPQPRPAPPPSSGPPPPGVLPSSALSPGWAGLCAEIDGFEADTDEEVLGFFAAQLAGHTAHAGSVRDLADRMLHAVGLDPAFAQGVAEYADENADMTGGVTMLDRQFRMIYDTLRAWADEHPMGMPHRAREFLQGGEPPLPEAGDDGMAA